MNNRRREPQDPCETPDVPAQRPTPPKPRTRGTRRTPAAQAAPVLQLDLVVDEYERDLRRRDVSPKTIKNYVQILGLAIRCWQEQLGRPPTLDDVTVRAGEAFLDHLMARGNQSPWAHHDDNGHEGNRHDEHKALSRETLRTYIRALKVFSSWLAAPKQRYTLDNRLALLQMPSKAETYKLPLEADEVQRLLDTCDITTVFGSRDLAILLTFLDGGLRASDLAQLKVGHVNLESGKLFIEASKGRKSRTVTVGDTTKRILRRYAFMRDASAGAKAGPGDPFFRNKRGEAFRYEGLRQLLRRLKTRAGVNRAFLHLLRHTSAVRTLEVPGSDLITLQEKLGHADITTTRRYIHMASATLSERQRAFSPIDHQGLAGLMRLVPPEKTEGRLFHRPQHLSHQSHPSQQRSRARAPDGGRGTDVEQRTPGQSGVVRDAAAHRRREEVLLRAEGGAVMSYPCTHKHARGPPPHQRSARTLPSSEAAMRLEERSCRKSSKALENERRKKRLGAQLPRDPQAFGNRNHIVTRAGATNTGTPARTGKGPPTASSTPPRRGGRYVYSTRFRRTCA